MTTRYSKATDGSRTYFRASARGHVYQSLSVDPTCERIEFGWTMHHDSRGAFPAVEITGQEYRALVALKLARFAAMKAAWIAANPGKELHRSWFSGTAPRDSWISNDALPVAGWTAIDTTTEEEPA